VSAATTESARGELPSLELPAIRELAGFPRWVLWRWAERGGKATKKPICTTEEPASTTNPATWATFDEVARAFVRGVGDGVGFVFTDTPFAGVDLDHAIGADGRVAPWAQAIVRRIDSYTEQSVSGTGLHVIVRGALAGSGRKAGPIECYDTGRYFVMTGRHVQGTPELIHERGEILRAWAAETFRAAARTPGGGAGKRRPPAPWDGSLPARVALARAQDPTVRLLLAQPHRRLGYGSPSEADWALAATLAEAGYPAVEIEHALRWRHRHVEPRPKWLGYFPLTADEAIGAVEARREGPR